MEGWLSVATPVSLGTAIVRAGPGRSDGVWIATIRQIRKYTKPEPDVTLERPEGFRGDKLQLLEDFQGNLWAGGAVSGLKVWMHGKTHSSASRTGGSIEARILTLFEDRERNVLVGTAGGGLARFKPRPFQVHLARLGGLVGALVNAVCEESPGTMLVGTEGTGLHRVRNNGGVERVVTKEGIPSAQHRVTSLLKLRDGGVLMAVGSLGVFRLEGEHAVKLETGIDGRALVRAMFEDKSGRIWIGHAEGITLGENGRFRSFPEGGNAPLKHVKCFAQDQAGTVWVVGVGGLMRVNGGSLERLELVDAPDAANLLCVFADNDGTLWVAAENRGLIRIRNSRQTLFGTGNGLPVLSIGTMLSEDSFLWLAGEKGIVRMEKPSFERVVSGKTPRLDLQLFNRADGLPSDATRRGYQDCAIRDSEGRLWFATHKGVTSLNPAGTRHISIRCTTPSLGRPEYSRFQYRLDGVDDRWVDAEGDRVVRLYDLQPGEYRFRVRAFGTDGRIIEPYTTLALEVLPLYWQTRWFRAGIVLGLMTLAGWWVWRAQQVRIVRRDVMLTQQEDHSKLERQLQHVHKMESVGRLASGIAHDFNNLLTVIPGNTQLLRLKATNDADQIESLDALDAASMRARDLVNQILAYSRQQASKLTAVDLAPSIRETCKLIRSGIPSTVALQTELPDSLPPVLADVPQIQRIIMNLCTNSAQAVPSVGGRIHVRVLEERVKGTDRSNPAVPPGHYVVLSVQDNGHGMDAPTRQKVFDPFFTTKEVGKGTGLGLSVVHGIVETHGGIITLRSQPGEGAIFEVYLPVTEHRAVAASNDQPELKEGLREVVLLVDDEPAVLNIGTRILERLGYTVESELNPVEAVKRFETSPTKYQLVITDFAMPQMDGAELARQLWKVRPGIPIILCTGYGGSITPDAARQMGFNRMISKPFEIPTLSEAVSATLKNSR